MNKRFTRNDVMTTQSSTRKMTKQINTIQTFSKPVTISEIFDRKYPAVFTRVHQNF